MTNDRAARCGPPCALVVEFERRIERLEHLMAQPIFPVRHDDGRPRMQRYPKFWFDIPVRDAVFALHRQITIRAAVVQLVARFGATRAPSESALQRCWKQLDLAREGVRNGGA